MPVIIFVDYLCRFLNDLRTFNLKMISVPGALLRAYDTTNTEFLDVLIELERKDVVSQHAVQKYLTVCFVWIHLDSVGSSWIQLD